jgi:DNA-binding FrmR family transcriptional regulator
MQNRDLAQKKLSRIEGKLKTIRVMMTRKDTTTKDISDLIDSIDNELEGLNTMIARQGDTYGR